MSNKKSADVINSQLLQLAYNPNNVTPFREYYIQRVKAEYKTFGHLVLEGKEQDHRKIAGLFIINI